MYLNDLIEEYIYII